MKKRNLKLIQWCCRIIPIIMWGFYVMLMFFPEEEINELFPINSVFLLIFIFVIFLYIGLVFFVLPGLIFGDRFNGLLFYLISWAFAGFTVGLGPVMVYWLKVDKHFSELISKENL